MLTRIAAVMFVLSVMAIPRGTLKSHPDYVPDQKTAERIAGAVLDSMYGHERVEAQLPLRAESADKDYWLVQGSIRQPHGPGGNFGVWINKHSGCIANVVEKMK